MPPRQYWLIIRQLDLRQRRPTQNQIDQKWVSALIILLYRNQQGPIFAFLSVKVPKENVTPKPKPVVIPKDSILKK